MMAQDSLKKTEAIISSMTLGERRNPDVLNASRRRRIAAGSGTSVEEVNRLVKQFRDMQRLMKQMGLMGRLTKKKKKKGGKERGKERGASGQPGQHAAEQLDGHAGGQEPVAHPPLIFC